jgi:hypothetical protein
MPSENPYIPPQASTSVEPVPGQTQVVRRPLTIAILMASLAPLIFLIEERLHPAVTCGCLIAAPLIAALSQAGRWRIFGLFICVCYTIFSSIVGSVLFMTIIKPLLRW